MNVKLHPLHYSIHSRLRSYHLKKYLRQFCKNENKIKMLDVGCGLGYLTSVLGKDYFSAGVDFDLHSLQINKNNGLQNMTQSDVINLPFKNNTFDVIICSEVLEHLKDGDDLNLLKELSRVLSEKGIILITVPSKHGVRTYSKLRNLGHSDPDGKEYHHRIGYASQDVRQLTDKTESLKINSIKYSMFLLSELFMDLLKYIYFKKNSLKEHSDIMETKNTFLFKLYKLVFPILFGIFIMEDYIFCRFFKGHILIVCCYKYSRQ
ncbi:MAG: type 11 methyltransferase [uncultured bacterium]|nr:MAG: type 11 methyltransferase [uncultured bacterium]